MIARTLSLKGKQLLSFSLTIHWRFGLLSLVALDYSPSFSMSDSQLGWASFTIRSQKKPSRSVIVKYRLLPVKVLIDSTSITNTVKLVAGGHYRTI